MASAQLQFFDACMLQGLRGSYLERTEEKIQDSANDPWHNTQFLKGQHRGKRELRLNRTDRLVFVICEDAKNLNATFTINVKIVMTHQITQ